jgi:hypothetical protein
MQLSMRYGWKPENDHVDIEPADDWSDDDYEKLCRLLPAAISPLSGVTS